jgi:hypothetical protein
MISVFYCTRASNPKHLEHLKKTCGLKDVEIIEYINNGEGLTKPYNDALKSAKYDIVVFLHDDIEIRTDNWGNKILKHYKRNPEYGILGVAGTKYLSTTGKWWDDKKKMYGQVFHTHEGKTWLSAYSKDQGNQLEEVCLVDGLFFSVCKSRLKHNFDESVTGFHFYDVTFCVPNYLSGVKIGVHTDIKVNHMSIGVTNDEWEQNRVLFAAENKEHLPINIKKIYGKNDKIKVLIGCLNFNSYTGSELHFYELAKELIKQGCEVSICSNLAGGDLANRAKTLGIKLYNLNEPPGYKLGDGKWMLKTAQGDVASKENTLYSVTPTDFDILHLSHKPIVEHLMKLYPDVPVISTIHSEVIELEYPVINDRIKKYIAIRPEIKQFLIDRFNIDESKIGVIYNPINNTRFKPIVTKKRDKKRILFVGTMDYLRENTINDLINETRINGSELYLVGKKNGLNVDSLLIGNDHVKYFPPVWNIEKYIQDCDETAGILLGRTTIESWMCEKPAWIYEIDEQGNIKSKRLNEVPSDIDKFISRNVVNQTIEEYKNIIS